jgi:KUP system potassium uptake protein
MVLTTALLYTVMRKRWGWSAPLALLTSGAFLVVDAVFFAANMLKVAEGGWIPLTLGAILFVVMTTWRAGIEAVRNRMGTMTEPPEQFVKRLQENKIPRVARYCRFSNPDYRRHAALDDRASCADRYSTREFDRPHS